MNVVTKDEFLTALRDGSYQQGFGALRRDYTDGGHGHCCLGVFCDKADPDSWAPAIGDTIVNTFAESWANLSSDDALEAFAITLGFDHAQRMEFDAVRTRLMNMNDGTSTMRRHTFAEIADWIEFEMDGFVTRETEALNERIVLTA